MKIRRYYADDITEGFFKVKKELGVEAIILQTRKVRRPGIKGFFLPRRVEIIAALDPPRPVPSMENELKISSRIESEIVGLKAMVKTLVNEPCAEGKTVVSKTGDESGKLYWHNCLQSHDVDPAIIDEVFADLTQKNKGNSADRSMLAHLLREQFNTGIPLAEEGQNRILVFIGPTGVGKTTTMAKLAARFSLNRREKVGLVTIDHFRIGAVDQLKAYAEIMDLPMEVAFSPRDLSEALMRLKDCDRILVDTAGRATRNLSQVNELAEYMGVLDPAEVHLVISATTRYQDIRLIADSFSTLNYNRLLITKIDETTSYGAILNGAYYSNRPLVYVTNGQSVPDHLALAREMDWAGLLLEGEK